VRARAWFPGPHVTSAVPAGDDSPASGPAASPASAPAGHPRARRPEPPPGATTPGAARPGPRPPPVSLATILLAWGRIGAIGFGGPPAHIRLLRDLCVERRKWLNAQEFEDAIAVCNLLPGPASTQLAIFCAWRLRGRPGALAGGVAFIVPGLIVILALAVLFLSTSPPLWGLGAGAGGGAPVPAVALPRGARPARGSLAGCETRARRVALPACRGRLRGHPRSLAGAGAAGLRADRAHGAGHRRAPRPHPAAGHRGRPGAGGRCHRRRGAAVGGLGGVQGRRPVLRRRVR